MADPDEHLAQRYLAMRELLEEMAELARRPVGNALPIAELRVILDGHLDTFDDAQQEELADVAFLVVTTVQGPLLIHRALRNLAEFVELHPA